MRLALLDNLSLPRACLVALFAGALNVLSFAPFFIWPIQIISLALMFLLFIGHPDWNKKQIAKLGFSYAFGTMALGVSWLTIAMTRYGGMPWLLAILFVSLLAAYMSLFIMMAFALSRYLQQRWKLGSYLLLLVLLPALFTLCEYLRSYLFTGFPWLSVGYAHTISPLSGFAPIFGVYGLAGLAATSAGALALLLAAWNERFARCLSLGLIGSIFGVGLGLQSFNWTHAHGSPLTVRLAQGNIDQGEKFSVEFVDRTLQMYSSMITERSADIIAVPETAIPILTSQLPADYLQGLQNFATSSHSKVFVGVAIDDGNNKYANSVLGLGANANDSGYLYRYDKHHLVPFGEFVPPLFQWFVRMMNIPLGDFSRGDVAQPSFVFKDERIAPNICYEDLFGEELARSFADPDKAPTIMVNLSNIAWFGDTVAIDQHLHISRMRALELGRPMLRATNTGATAIINAQGQVTHRLPSAVQGALTAEVFGVHGPITPYAQWVSAFGLWPLAGLAVLALLIVAAMAHASRHGQRRFGP